MGDFDGIITAEMKQLHKDAIDALLESTALTLPCRLIYGDTKWTDCSNCVFSPSTGKSSNRYQAGGPIPFTTGRCPYCNGVGRIADEQTEDLDLGVIFEMKKWIVQLGGPSSIKRPDMANTPDSYVRTLSSFVTTYEKLKRAKEIIVDIDIESSTQQRYIRVGEPQPCGFGASHFVTALWEKVS